MAVPRFAHHRAVKRQELIFLVSATASYVYKLYILSYIWFVSDQTRLKPNTHRRRRRDETVLSRRVGVGGVYMNSRRLPTDSKAQHSRQRPVYNNLVTTADGCVHTDDTTKLSPTSCEFVYTPPTRRDSTVSSRRRCVLGLM